MIKNKVQFEATIAEKLGHFICDNDCPIAVIKEMLCQFLKEVGQVEDQIKAQMDAQAAQKKTEEANAPIEANVESKIEPISG